MLIDSTSNRLRYERVFVRVILISLVRVQEATNHHWSNVKLLAGASQK